MDGCFLHGLISMKTLIQTKYQVQIWSKSLEETIIPQGKKDLLKPKILGEFDSCLVPMLTLLCLVLMLTHFYGMTPDTPLQTMAVA